MRGFSPLYLEAGVEVDKGFAGPESPGNALVDTSGVALHEAVLKKGVDKGAEDVDGIRLGRGHLVATVLVAQNPITIVFLLEQLGQAVGAIEHDAERADQTVVVDNLIGRAMEETGGCGWCKIAEAVGWAEDGPCIRDDGSRFKTFGQGGGLRHGIGPAVVGLQHRDGAGTAAGEDDTGRVDRELGGVVAEIGDGFGTVGNSPRDGGIHDHPSIQEHELGTGLAKIKPIVDRDSYKALIGKGLADILRLLAVTCALVETASKKINHTGVVRPRMSRLVNIQLKL